MRRSSVEGKIRLRVDLMSKRGFGSKPRCFFKRTRQRFAFLWQTTRPAPPKQSFKVSFVAPDSKTKHRGRCTIHAKRVRTVAFGNANKHMVTLVLTAAPEGGSLRLLGVQSQNSRAKGEPVAGPCRPGEAEKVDMSKTQVHRAGETDNVNRKLPAEEAERAVYTAAVGEPCF